MSNISSGRSRVVSSAKQLEQALADPTISVIVVDQSISGLSSFFLAGKTLRGATRNVALTFTDGSEGIVVGADAAIINLRVNVRRDLRAISNRTDIAALGKLSIDNVQTVGQVQILGKDQLTDADIDFDRLTVIDADAYDRPDRPASGTAPNAGNVDIIQGAITIFNMQPDASSLFKVRLRRVSLGSLDRPVRGSGILLSGAAGNIYTDPGVTHGGRVIISELETGNVYIHSQIPEDTAGLIAGAVFVAYAQADKVLNTGDTISNGNNGLGLDNWGDVQSWTSLGRVQTYGKSGIGIVHFGQMDKLSVASVETFGSGARAFNALTGRIRSISFGSVRTNGAGASGIYVTTTVDEIRVGQNITTYGAGAMSLESGVITLQFAIALRLDKATVGSIVVDGSVVSHGDGSAAISIEHSAVDHLEVGRGVLSSGKDTNAIKVVESSAPLADMRATSTDGAAVSLEAASISAMTEFEASGVIADVVVQTGSSVETRATSIRELETGFGNAFEVSGPGILRLVPTA